MTLHQLSPNPLSERESEILNLISDGLNNSQIAKRLKVSVNTIRSHRKNLYCKLNVKKATGAIMKGFRLGYLQTRKESSKKVTFPTW